MLDDGNDPETAGDVDNLTYRKKDLLKRLLANRKVHESTYTRAMIQYRKRVITAVSTALRNAKAGKDIPYQHNLPKPETYVKEYDRAITMLEMTTMAEIKLDADRFKQLVMDEWPFSHQFTSSTIAYAKIKKQRAR